MNNTNMKVSVAATKARVAEEVYAEFCEKFPQEYQQQDTLRAIANEADAELLQARHDALNECTCKPDLPDGRCFPLCPVCKADIDRRYGSGIPFEFGGQP